MNGCIWITGASTGIGYALALKCASEGRVVAASARSLEDLKALQRAGGDLIRIYPVDVTSRKAVAAVVDDIRKNEGEIEIAVLNAGIYKAVQAKRFVYEDVRALVQTNFIGFINCLDTLLPEMVRRRSGHIAVVSSGAGYFGLPHFSAYGATKAALINMTEALYLELKHYGIKVQLICPGFVRTRMTERNDIRMPMVMEPYEAAEYFWKGLHANKFEVTFPRSLLGFVRIFRGLPYWFHFAVIRLWISNVNPKVIANNLRSEKKYKVISAASLALTFMVIAFFT